MFQKPLSREPDLLEIKDRTRILFIDDQSRQDIVDYLKEEGWKARHTNDPAAIDIPEINDSHIICVDIKGVGHKLKKEFEGLDIAASIKKRFPQKKVILYSSQATHDIFHEANKLVDKRIHKSSGDFEVFRNDIEELAREVFSWSSMAASSYNLVKKSLPKDITFEKYEKLLQKVAGEKTISDVAVSKYLPIAANLAQVISLILQVFKS